MHMKVKLQNPIKIGIFVLLMLFISAFLSHILVPPFTHDTEQGDLCGYDDKMKDFYSQPDNSIDVLFIGQSTNLYSFLPIELWRMYGFTSYQLSSAEQEMATSYYLLEECLEHQNPKSVVLEISSLFYNDYNERTSRGNNNYKIIKNIRNIRNRWKAFIATKPNDHTYVEWISSLYRFHSRWSNISEQNFKAGEIDYPQYYKGGLINASQSKWWGEKSGNEVFAITSDAYRQNFYDNTDRDTELYLQNKYNPAIDEEAKFYFELIKSRCNQQNIELICVKGPSAVGWSEKTQTTAKDYLFERNLELVDLNYGTYKVDIDWDSDTVDCGYHVNYFGALKCTEFIGKYLSDKLQLADHRGNEDYREWDELYSEYVLEIDNIISTNNEKAYRWIEENLDNLDQKAIMIAVMDDISAGWNEIYDDLFKKTGIQTNFYDGYQKSYVAFIDDGKVKFERLSDEIILYRDVIRDIGNKLYSIELISAGLAEGNMCSIRINDEETSCAEKGMNIVIFDKQSGTVSKCVAVNGWENGSFIESNG